MKVLARRPGYGGWNVCEVIGETSTRYSLRYDSYDLKYPMDYVTSYAPDDAPREWTTEVFFRRKSKCYPVNQESE